MSGNRKNCYGSGNFGLWVYDEYGLPAYQYECNQYQIPEKMPFVNKDSIWGDYRNHFNQIGNDRIIGITSNFGYIKIRQDEGGPKFLNDYTPKNRQYAGGFGYFVAGTNCLGTFYQEQENFERVFGCGYFKKRVWDSDYDLTQTVFAPYGDDPCLVSKVTVKNNTDTAVESKWIEYWGHDVYQMSYRAQQYAAFKEVRRDYNYYFRKEFAKNFKRTYSDIERGAMVDFMFTGFHYPEKNEAKKIASIEEVNELIKPFVSDNATYEDLNQPSMFVMCMTEDVEIRRRYSGQSFFENENLIRPTGIDSTDDSKEKDALIVEASFTLKPGESKDLYFLIGYLPEGYSLENLAVKYKYTVAGSLQDTMAKWNENLITMEILNSKEDEWIKRELIWHNYFLRSCITYDSSIRQHILNQGCNYQYIVGNNVFVRDIAQHLAPYIYSDPKMAKELIDYELKMVDYNGMIFGGLTGNGVLVQDPRVKSDLPAFFVKLNAGGSDMGETREDNRPPMEQRYDDQELWPLWIVSEYVLANKDFDYLDEIKIGYFSLNKEPRTVLEICKQLFDYTKNEVGTGKHGLIRLLWNDWSRALFHKKRRPVPPEDAKTASKIAESLFATTLAIHCTQIFAQLLREIGDGKAQEVQQFCDDLKKAVNDIWNGKWIQRLWVNDHYGFLGDKDEFFMEGQPWTLVSQALPEDRARTLIHNMKELVMDPSPIGAAKQRVSPEYDDKSNDGWVWWSLNGPLIWGMIPYDRELAFKEYKKNSLAQHAQAYPDIWFGIWSADDNYTSFLNEYPGYTRFRPGVLENKMNYMEGHPDDFEIPDAINFPVACVHPHAWPLYDCVKFLQPKFTKEGVEIKPSLPKEEYQIKTKLIGYTQTKEKITGYYQPLQCGSYKVTLDLSALDKTFSVVIVNGTQVDADLGSGIISFEGMADTKLVWEIR